MLSSEKFESERIR